MLLKIIRSLVFLRYCSYGFNFGAWKIYLRSSSAILSAILPFVRTGGFAASAVTCCALFQPLNFDDWWCCGWFYSRRQRQNSKGALKALLSGFQGSKYNKALFMELMTMLFDVLTKIRKEGLRCRLKVISRNQSPLFSKYTFVSDHHLMEFSVITWCLMVSGNMDAVSNRKPDG